MTLKKHLLACLVFVFIIHNAIAQGGVSVGINQVLGIKTDHDNPPTTLHVRLYTSIIDIKHIKGTRVIVDGSVKLSFSNLIFLQELIKKGRYLLYISPSGSGFRIEDKDRQPIVLQGEACQEIVSYILYIPETIGTVVLENAKTGESSIIPVNKEVK